MSRKELELMGIIMNDEQYENFKKQFSEIQEKVWEEDHPLDD